MSREIFASGAKNKSEEFCEFEVTHACAVGNVVLRFLIESHLVISSVCLIRPGDGHVLLSFIFRQDIFDV